MWMSKAVFFSTIILTQCIKFGPHNSYTCHCFNDELCDKDTGECGGGCAIGWSGATCQKQNVALDKPSGQIKFNRANREAGHKTTNATNKCSNTDMTRTWWGIDLLKEYPIKHIIIQPNWDFASVDAFFLYVIKENEEPELCYKERIGVSPPHVKDIECNQVITGRYVNISNDYARHSGRYLTFCQMEIYVCAEGTFGSDCTNFCHCSNNERCSETGECPNGCSNGWTGITCSQICGDGTYGAGCLKQCSERNCSVETSPCNHINGSCEGGCTEGFYGEVCDMKCSDRKCKDSNLQCESKTGECIDGCLPGYQTIDCTRECDNGTYGPNCSKNCSARFCNLEAECNKVDGACNCSDGYQGIDCTVKQVIVVSRDGIEGSDKQSSTIVTIVVPIIVLAAVAVAAVILFIRKRRLESTAHQYHGNKSRNDVQQEETTIELQVTEPSCNNQYTPSSHFLEQA